MSMKSDKWIKERCAPIIYMASLLANGKVVGQPRPLPTSVIESEPRLAEELYGMQAGDALTVAEQNLLVHAVAQKPLISPFIDKSVDTILVDGVAKKVPSYGLSSYGYDIRIGRNFKKLRPSKTPIVLGEFTEDDYDHFDDVTAIVIAPGEFMLGVSEERICLPRNVSAICMAKSTWARSAVTAEVTPLEAGWEGHVTIEIHNKSELHQIVYAGIGCMQLMFFESEPCLTSYAERKGKYMDQPNVPIIPKM